MMMMYLLCGSSRAVPWAGLETHHVSYLPAPAAVLAVIECVEAQTTSFGLFWSFCCCRLVVLNLFKNTLK